MVAGSMRAFFSWSVQQTTERFAEFDEVCLCQFLSLQPVVVTTKMSYGWNYFYPLT